uniref:Sema domain-containing protein n=2 Tax=Parascaris univalens TaxID=6257 RepID=A0A915B0J3_PARUN
MQILFILAYVVRISAMFIQGDSDANRTVISVVDDASVLRFGNQTTADYFRLLDLDGEYLLIGARDVVYNISIGTFAEIQSIKWPSKQSVVNECLMKGKPKDACHNFVRVLAKDAASEVLVCGTNAFQPMCRQYDREKYGEYRQILEFSGLGISPYDPSHNSTFLRDGDVLYAGTVSDFSGADPLIHRRNVSKLLELGIRTERNDVKFLNEPQFAGSFKDEKYVYLWFREQAAELDSCSRAIYSRVARLCRSDMGGPRPYSNEWTSFVKARLNCSVPGDYPFYFDQIEAIAPPVSGRYSAKDENARLVYAVFRSPLAGVSASAICAFDLTQITKVFSKSSYRSQANSRSPWTPAHDDMLSKHRPGTCVKDSRTLSEEAVAFVRSSPLADDAVHNYFGAPLSIHSGSDHFTQIAVDAQVRALDGRYYDVVFVGTSGGNVFKLVNLAGAAAKTGNPSYHVYTLRVTNEPIRNMMLYEGKPRGSPYSDALQNFLIVVSDRSVVRIPASKCSMFASCVQCVSLRDPHCAWDIERGKCTNIDQQPGHFEQDIVEGRGTQLCADPFRFANSLGEIPIADQPRFSHQDAPLTLSLTSKTNNCSCAEKSVEMCASGGSSSSEISSESTVSTLSEQSSVIAVCTTIGILSILIGFFAGSFYSRCVPSLKSKGSARSLSSPTPQPVYNGTPLVRPCAMPSGLINAYESTSKFSTFVPRPQSPISLQVEEMGTPQSRVAWGTSTLPKDYRVKQMYL